MIVTRVPDPNKADGQPIVSSSVTYSVQSTIDRSVDIVAAELINKYDPVCITGQKASCYDSQTMDKFLGLATNDGAVGSKITVLVAGEVVNSAWSWVFGSTIFLGARCLSSTIPDLGYVQQVGVAKNATTMIVGARNSVQL